MKNITKTITALFLLLSVSMVNAGYAEGKRAYDNKDYSTALTELKPLAEQGDADAQYNLGAMYANGHGVKKNTVLAIQYYRMAEKKGNKKAGLNINKLLLDRVDIEPWSKTIQEESYAWTFDYISSYVKSTNRLNLSQDIVVKFKGRKWNKRDHYMTYTMQLNKLGKVINVEPHTNSGSYNTWTAPGFTKKVAAVLGEGAKLVGEYVDHQLGTVTDDWAEVTFLQAYPFSEYFDYEVLERNGSYAKVKLNGHFEDQAIWVKVKVNFNTKGRIIEDTPAELYNTVIGYSSLTHPFGWK